MWGYGFEAFLVLEFAVRYPPKSVLFPLHLLKDESYPGYHISNTLLERKKRRSPKGKKLKIFTQVLHMRNTNTIASDRLRDIDLCIICAYWMTTVFPSPHFPSPHDLSCLTDFHNAFGEKKLKDLKSVQLFSQNKNNILFANLFSTGSKWI